MSNSCVSVLLLDTTCPSTSHWNCMLAVSSLFCANDVFSNVISQGPQLVVSIGVKEINGLGYTVRVSVITSIHPLSVCVVNSNTYNIESGPGFILNSKLGKGSYGSTIFQPDEGVIISQL